jgi:tRNA pseudouridine55 synthase
LIPDVNFNGVINIDKPAGLTSARVVDRVKRLLPRGTKVGHAGTLDPFATGVLLVLVGNATKACERLMGMRKGYDAVVKLGARTATDDPETPEEVVEGAVPPSAERVREAAAGLVGEIMQRPPTYSAMKVGGRRAYDLARGGKEVELEARPVVVYALEVFDYSWPLVRIRVECGRGTYIRAIARDLGEALGAGGYLTQLRRTFIGAYRAENAVTLEKLHVDGVAPHLEDVL